MKRKVLKYLESKNKSEYDHFDKILEMSLTGELKEILSKYSGVGIYTSFYIENTTVQLTYNYNNIFVTIDFFEDKYCVVVYYEGLSVDDLEKHSVAYDYQNDFDLTKLIEEIHQTIINHPKLKDMTLIEKKKKVYSLISWISLCLPIIIFGSIGLYCIITERVVKLNMWWGVFFIVIPLIVWFIFDVKSKRLK